ncbi:MAG: helix-turn-helix domain-containing protein [Mesorhizobium sp.]|nr:helix-turn-helix domain-containing protein [Mesorhizobium sp.]MCO5161270.1 helix-turn-helix domain-containing protein [Mesorhizobium sp.]
MAGHRLDRRKVRIHRSYTIDEAARTLGTAKGTVRRWIDNGLPAIRDRKPILILGDDLIDFLVARRKPSQKCRLHECFCFTCRQPRAPAFGEVEFHPLTPTSGNLRALCEECTTVMHKRVAVAQLGALGALVTVTIKDGV